MLNRLQLQEGKGGSRDRGRWMPSFRQEMEAAQATMVVRRLLQGIIWSNFL